MTKSRNLLGATALGVGLMFGFAAPQEADAATCPTSPTSTDRIFTLTTTPNASCLDHGTSNINGNDDDINDLGYTTLDKTDRKPNEGYPLDPPNITLTTNPANSGTSGTFTFTADSNWINYVIAFKVGSGTADPDWAAFLLPTGVTSGNWSITGVNPTELSHANLYAQPVPVPAALPLLLTALGALGVIGRKKIMAA